MDSNTAPHHKSAIGSSFFFFVMVYHAVTVKQPLQAQSRDMAVVSLFANGNINSPVILPALPEKLRACHMIPAEKAVAIQRRMDEAIVVR